MTINTPPSVECRNCDAAFVYDTDVCDYCGHTSPCCGHTASLEQIPCSHRTSININTVVANDGTGRLASMMLAIHDHSQQAEGPAGCTYYAGHEGIDDDEPCTTPGCECNDPEDIDDARIRELMTHPEYNGSAPESERYCPHHATPPPPDGPCNICWPDDQPF